MKKTSNTEALAWIRKKLGLAADTEMFTGAPNTIAGALLCSDAHGMQTYIQAYKCDNKQGEIARLTVEVERLKKLLMATNGSGDPLDA